jgi:hypothetical protein
MAKQEVKRAITSKLVRVFIQDSSQTDGRGLTGLLFNSAGLAAYYIKEGQSAPTAITLVTMTVGTWVSGGFKEVDPTNMPGFYELGLPDAMLSTGNSVAAMLRGAANMVPVPLEIELVAYDPQDAVRLGLTALPNVAAGANGGLPTGDASGRVTVGSLAAAAIQSIWDALTSALTTSGSVGKRIADNLDAAVSSRNATTPPTAAAVSTQVWGEALPGSFGAGTAGQKLNGAASAGDPWGTALPGAYGSGTAGNLVGNRLDAAVGTRASQASADTLAGYVDTEVAAIKAKTDALPASPAAVGSVMQLDFAQAVPAATITALSHAGTVGKALAALLGEVAGNETMDPNTRIWTKKNLDGTTLVTFLVDDAADPTVRTMQ